MTEQLSHAACAVHVAGLAEPGEASTGCDGESGSSSREIAIQGAAGSSAMRFTCVSAGLFYADGMGDTVKHACARVFACCPGELVQPCCGWLSCAQTPTPASRLRRCDHDVRNGARCGRPARMRCAKGGGGWAGPGAGPCRGKQAAQSAQLSHCSHRSVQYPSRAPIIVYFAGWVLFGKTKEARGSLSLRSHTSRVVRGRLDICICLVIVAPTL